MAMSLNSLGYSVTEDQVNEVMGARPMKGAAWEQALACAQHYGCRATLTMPATVSQLKEWTDKGIPVMIAWNPEGRPWSHASVVFDVDDERNVHVADPNIPNPEKTVRVVSEDEFYHLWYEKWPDYMVRRPACAIEREITVDGRQTKQGSMIRTGRPVDRIAERYLQSMDIRDPNLRDEHDQGWTKADLATANNLAAVLKGSGAVPDVVEGGWNLSSVMLNIGPLFGDRYHAVTWQIQGATPPNAAMLPSFSIVFFPSINRNPEYKGIEQSLAAATLRLKAALAQFGTTEIIKSQYPGVTVGVPEENLERFWGKLPWMGTVLGKLVRQVLDTQVKMRTAKKSEPVAPPKKDKNKIVIESPEKRNEVMQQYINQRARGTGGAGTHHNREYDVEKGKGKPKHKKPIERDASDNIWKSVSDGWRYIDDEIKADLFWEDTWTTVKDRNIPDLDEINDVELLADGIPELEKQYHDTERAWQQWTRQGWWPKPVKSQKLTLMIMHRPSRKAFEASFTKDEVQQAMRRGAQAIEVIRNRKYPAWMVPSRTASAVDPHWVTTAKKLLADKGGTTQDDLHYRAYLRAVISGNQDQMVHLAQQFPGAKAARQELIDLFGTGKYAVKLDSRTAATLRFATDLMNEWDVQQGWYVSAKGEDFEATPSGMTFKGTAKFWVTEGDRAGRLRSNPEETTYLATYDAREQEVTVKCRNHLHWASLNMLFEDKIREIREMYGLISQNRQAATDSRYKGNPDGQPVYDHVVDHGVDQPLSGGFDVMKQLQNEYLKEQGRPERENTPRLARWIANISDQQVDRVAARHLDRTEGSR